MTAVRRVAAGTLSLFCLVALLVGVPIALAMAVGWPLPHSWPTTTQVRTVLETSGIPDVILIDTLAIVCWIAWLDFALATCIEVGAAVRRRPAPRVAAARPWQPVVARLVTAIVLAVTIMNTRPSPGGRQPSVPLAAALATQHADLSGVHGRPGPDRDATMHVGRPASPQAQADAEYVVRRGDTLWGISGRHLGDPRRWPEIWRANRERSEPQGRVFTDPNLIVPGWELDLANGTPAGNGSPPAATPQPPSAPRPPLPPLPSAPPPAPAPSVSATGGGGAMPAIPPASQEPVRPTPAPPAPMSSPGARASAPPDSRSASPGIQLPSGGIVGISLATAIAAALAAGRLHERRRYRVGSGEPSAVEDLVTPNITRLGRAATAAVVGGRPGTDAPRIALPPDRLLHALRARACGPAEIPIGLTADGRDQVIVETDSLSGLALAGPGAEPAARALLVAALADHRPWRSEVLVTSAIAALLDGGPALINARTVDDLSSALDVLEDELIRRRRALALRDAEDYRTTLDKADPMDTLLAVLDGPSVGAGDAGRIDTIVGLGRRLGLAIVVVGEARGLETIDVAADGGVAIGAERSIGDAAQLFVLSAQEAAEMLAVVAAGQGQPIERRGAADPTPDPPASDAEPPSVVTPATSGPERPVLLRLFGPPRVDVLGSEVITGLRGRGRELLWLLVIRREGVRQEELLDILWPDDRADWERTREQLTTAVTSTRRRLRDLTGERRADFIVFSGDDRYRLDPTTVDADLWRFEAALADATCASSEGERLDALERAAAAAPMEPLAGAVYPWAEAARERIRRRATDALCELADLREAAGQGARALAALEVAQAIDPCREEVYQRLIALQCRLGRGDAAHRAYRELARELQELGETPSAETAALLRTAVPASPDPGASRRTDARPTIHTPSTGSIHVPPHGVDDDEGVGDGDVRGRSALAMRRVALRPGGPSGAGTSTGRGDGAPSAQRQPLLPILDDDPDADR